MNGHPFLDARPPGMTDAAWIIERAKRVALWRSISRPLLDTETALDQLLQDE